MATTPNVPPKRQNTNLPPKRGQIKAQIFGGFVETVVAAASKVGEVLGKIRGGGSVSGSGGSASASPPPSSYNSDG